jgi:hypothetical protein
MESPTMTPNGGSEAAQESRREKQHFVRRGLKRLFAKHPIATVLSPLVVTGGIAGGVLIDHKIRADEHQALVNTELGMQSTLNAEHLTGLEVTKEKGDFVAVATDPRLSRCITLKIVKPTAGSGVSDVLFLEANPTEQTSSSVQITNHYSGAALENSTKSSTRTADTDIYTGPELQTYITDDLDQPGNVCEPAMKAAQHNSPTTAHG